MNEAEAEKRIKELERKVGILDRSVLELRGLIGRNNRNIGRLFGIIKTLAGVANAQ